MRNPNGYGSVVKLSGNRRKPFVARKTVGFNDKGHPIYEPIGYYAERKEAMMALAAYNMSPYDLASRKLTFSELYDLFVERKYTDNDKKVKNGYAAAYKACSAIHDVLFSDLRTLHLQKEINNWDKSYASKKNMRILFNLLYKFAIQNDIVDKNYASFIELSMPDEDTEQLHKPFTAEELATLWDNKADRSAQYVLIYCYSGLRPSELIKIKTADVHLEERYMVGGIKNRTSKNRAIPIAEKIYPFISAMYNPDNEFLVTDFDGPLSYDGMIWRYWKPLMQKLDMNHLPHDGRHTCATLLDNCGVNKTVVKKILGHAGLGTTEKVYTHKTIQQLVEAINLI